MVELQILGQPRRSYGYSFRPRAPTATFGSRFFGSPHVRSFGAGIAYGALESLPTLMTSLLEKPKSVEEIKEEMEYGGEYQPTQFTMPGTGIGTMLLQEKVSQQQPYYYGYGGYPMYGGGMYGGMPRYY